MKNLFPNRPGIRAILDLLVEDNIGVIRQHMRYVFDEDAAKVIPYCDLDKLDELCSKAVATRIDQVVNEKDLEDFRFMETEITVAEQIAQGDTDDTDNLCKVAPEFYPVSWLSTLAFGEIAVNDDIEKELRSKSLPYVSR